MIPNPRSKYLRFKRIQRPPNRKTDIVSISNGEDGTHLGSIAWETRFRKYAFYPAAELVFDADCLADILAAVELMMQEHE